MAEAAVTFLVDIVFGESEPGIEDVDLGPFKAFLVDDANRSKDLVLERQIKELVYDSEEIHESWNILATTNSLRSRYLLDKVNRALAAEINFIVKYRIRPMKRIIREIQDLGQVETEANQIPSAQLNRKVPPIGTKSIVGLEDEAKNLISSLVEETEELDVISITGMPGSGKTTLACKIYQSEEIHVNFQSRIWVDLPERFSRKDLFISILKAFHYDGKIDLSKKEDIDENGLYGEVRACLEKSRFLLVLDSVWTADNLRSSILLLPKNGKVLITSRSTSVCVDANGKKKPHMKCLLNDQECWNLLQLKVFGKLGDCPQQLKSMGECIAKNCGGSPLAIVAVASSLMAVTSTEVAKYLNEKWWKKVSENMIVYAEDHDQQRYFSSVDLSYIKLAPHLQDCFLYLGVFPEGHEIPVQTLTRLWIAERFVKDSESLTLEESAEKILDDLIDENLVMVGRSYPNGRIKTCRLHKLIYRFCKYKAAELEFYHEMDLSKGEDLGRSMLLPPSHRRLCILSGLSEFLSRGPEGRSVRSILCLHKADNEVLHPEKSSNIHKSFKSLRVLECKYVKFKNFPTKLRKMRNLRYISISCDDLGAIPKSLSSLRYLKTLVVDTQSASLELEANIWKMPLLRHLVTKAAIVVAIQGEGVAGKNLQTLTRLAPGCCTEDVFKRVPNLKTLGIRGRIAHIPAAGEALRKLESLENLKLIDESPSEDTLSRSPNFFPPTIRRLTLSGTRLGWESMSVLGMIVYLEILKLKNNAFTGESWNTDEGGFRRLGFLSIGTTDLVSWEVSSTDCFPKLKWLVLKKCEKLEKIPSTLAMSLDTLEMVNVSESAVQSAKLSEWEKVKVHGL